MTEKDKQFDFERLVAAYENVIRHGYILFEAKKAKAYGIDGGYWYEIVFEDEKTHCHVRIQAPSDNLPTNIYVYFDGEADINNIDIDSDSFHVIAELLLTMKNVLDEDGGNDKKIVFEFFDWLVEGMRLSDGNE